MLNIDWESSMWMRREGTIPSLILHTRYRVGMESLIRFICWNADGTCYGYEHHPEVGVFQWEAVYQEPQSHFVGLPSRFWQTIDDWNSVVLDLEDHTDRQTFLALALL